MFLFWMKKILGKMIMPLGLSSLLLVLGLVLYAGRRRKAGLTLIVIGTLVLILLSLPPVACLLLRPLETRYPVLDPASLPQNLGAIVVLAGGCNDRPELPAASRLGPSTLRRTLEGIRLWRHRPQSRLIMSSGSWEIKDSPPAESMADLAGELGVDPSKIAVETVSRDTYENAVEVKNLLGQGPFVLVTSASHLPRAMAIFHKLGLEPIPAPADQHLPPRMDRLSWLPSLGAQAVSQASLYEYAGLAWYWLRGRI